MTLRPEASEYAPYYARYVEAVPEGDVLDVLAAQPGLFTQMAAVLPESRETFRYAPGKWSIREVVSHIVDAERVFGYRAFSISRGEAQPLPSFDENAYVSQSGADGRPLAALVEEFALVRAANLAVFNHLDGEAWQRVGTASGQPVSVRALAYITAGHAAHHLNVLRERYAVA